MYGFSSITLEGMGPVAARVVNGSEVVISPIAQRKRRVELWHITVAGMLGAALFLAVAAITYGWQKYTEQTGPACYSQVDRS